MRTLTLPAVVAALLSVGVPESSTAAAGLRQVGIGMVLDGPSTDGAALSDRTLREINVLLEGEFAVNYEGHVKVGEWTTESIGEAVDELLGDPEVDVVVALGILGSQIFCCRQVLPKPVIAAVVIDAEIQGLPLTADGTSGVANLNYLTFPQSIDSDIETFLEIVPFDKLAVVFNRWFTAGAPQLLPRLTERIAHLGVQPLVVEVGDSVEEALAAIPEEAEAAYVPPLLHFSEEERRRFYAGLVERGLPSFAIFGVPDVERGALAGARDTTFYERLARRVALNVQRVLLGEKAGDLPVAVPDRRLLTINMATARALDTYPPWEVLAEADLLNEEPHYDRRLTLDGVVREAIDVNLDLLARRREVAAGEQDVARARSLLRPQLEAEASGVAIDQDRVSPFSAQGEITASAGLSVSQVVYSERAGANVAIQGELQRRRQEELGQLRLDIAEEAAQTYLEVLRAKTFQEIRKSDLRLTRSNLELARVRRSVGAAGPGEVYRWESALASARRDAVEAQAARYQAQEALNRLLHRWQAEGFDTADVGLDDPALITSKERIYAYVVTPRHFDVFSNFTIEYGLARAPELAQLDAAIGAEKRVLQSARRAFWSPDVGLQASLERILGTSGGTTLGLPGLPVSDETSWAVALRGTLPLFDGGARKAEVAQAEETLGGLDLERQALAERLEQRIRARLHRMQASYAGIGLTKEAAEAARKNRELVTDAYTRGAADVLDLLDAQSAGLRAELAAADALYQFFIDLVGFERAINRLDFFTSPEEDADWFAELDAYFRAAHVEPRPRREGER